MNYNILNMKIKISELEDIARKVLLSQYSEEHAELIKQVIMFGELSGKTSHGILRLLKENYGVFPPKKPGEIEYIKKTKISTVINGHNNVGMLVASLAMNEVIKLAKAHDIGVVGTRGSINTTGALSYYAKKIAEENFIGMVFTQSSLFMSAFDSKKPIFGTNPIAFGIPANPRPFIFDMSPAATTFGSIAKAKLEGTELSENVAADAEGNITTDPVKAMEGGILPLNNSYKNAGIAMIVEILGSLWPGGGFAGINLQDGWGNLYIAMSPNLLSETGIFKEKMNKLIEKLKSIETSTGKELRIPGENTFKIYDRNVSRGEIEVDENTIKKIRAAI